MIEKAVADAARGHVATALETLTPLAEGGDADAQYALARVHLQGGRVLSGARDPVAGRKWLVRAAERGHPIAQFDLAYLCFNDEKNVPEGVRWFRAAAEQHPGERFGDAAAEWLGLIYLTGGDGVPRDLVEARRWLLLAAERGRSRAQLWLGTMHLDGLAGPKDIAGGIRWLSAAAAQHRYSTPFALVFVHTDGVDMKPDVSEAARWITGRRITDPGEAAYHVGKFYSDGFHVNRDEQRLLAWWFARKGMAPEVAESYLKRLLDNRWADGDEAVRWFRIGAEAGFVGAQVSLAADFWDRNSPRWNCAEAARWVRIAADKEDPVALYNMGLMYLNGAAERVDRRIGIEFDDTDRGIAVQSVLAGTPAEAAGLQAGDLIVDVDGKEAAKLGANGFRAIVQAEPIRAIGLRVQREGDETPLSVRVTPAETRVACPDGESSGLRRDPAEALKWFEKSAARGDPAGLFMVARAYRGGLGVTQDVRMALKLYEQGAGRGDWQAAQEIAHMYSAGELGEKDVKRANEWFRKAVDLKHRSLGR